MSAVDRLQELPSGTVTFLFTDVEGSTRLLRELGPDGYASALAEHRRILREAFGAHDGVEVDTQGDAFFVAFPTAPGAVATARAITEGLRAGPISVRIGLHTGAPLLTDEGYVGSDVHRAARIAAAGHGGQVLVSASTVALVGTDGLRDLGEHRLKDLSAPERIYQLGAEDFPLLSSLHQTNLPIPSTPFLGRETELAEVHALLARDDIRLLTLTGPGGTGKTRLALQAAGALADRYPQGVWWVPLAALRDPGLVLASAAQALGAKDGLADFIGDKALLLLFDNFEHVVDAAGGVTGLLAACPRLEVLVTSREPLHVGGEQEYPVPPLAPEEGIGFFLARARAVQPDFQADDAVSGICRRLDDLPLALELAAARVKALSSGQILERLEQRLPLLTGGARDLPERQRTLRATIEWSHELLTSDEQRLFARLAVFSGGCTLVAAEEVADADLDTLQSLVDKSLLRHADERFWMLETIREYAAERLRERADEAAIRDRHLAHLLALAERAYEQRFASATTWFPIVAAEHDNIRAALDWARISRPEAEVQLAGAVADWWYLQGHGREARARLVGALAGHEPRDPIRARALTHLGDIEIPGPEAPAHLNEALRLWREESHVLGEALTLERIGRMHLYSGKDRPARLAFEQSLALRRQVGAPELEGVGALAGLCQLLVASGEIERVEPMAQTLYELGRRYGNADAEGDGLHYLADCPLIGGDYAEAEKRYLRALAHARNSGIVVQCPPELLGVAMSIAGRGDHVRAVRLAAAAYARREALGQAPSNPAHWWSRLQERHIGGARAQLGPEQAEDAERAGRDVPFDAVLDEVLGVGTASAQS
jgi:predicted ATPase/class 3 adenylate cyclase